MKFEYEIKDKRLQKIRSQITPTVRQSVKAITLSLGKTASETAPHDKGILQGSYAVHFKGSNGKKIVGTVEFNVKGDNGYNYAISMHEWTYTPSKPNRAGTGMSGASYQVGRKYLTRVLEGEGETYRDYIAKEIDKFLRS